MSACTGRSEIGSTNKHVEGRPRSGAFYRPVPVRQTGLRWMVTGVNGAFTPTILRVGRGGNDPSVLEGEERHCESARLLVLRRATRGVRGEGNREIVVALALYRGGRRVAERWVGQQGAKLPKCCWAGKKVEWAKIS
jgi:hypothetical protein